MNREQRNAEAVDSTELCAETVHSLDSNFERINHEGRSAEEVESTKWRAEEVDSLDNSFERTTEREEETVRMKQEQDERERNEEEDTEDEIEECKTFVVKHVSQLMETVDDVTKRLTATEAANDRLTLEVVQLRSEVRSLKEEVQRLKETAGTVEDLKSKTDSIDVQLGTIFSTINRIDHTTTSLSTQSNDCLTKQVVQDMLIRFALAGISTVTCGQQFQIEDQTQLNEVTVDDVEEVLDEEEMLLPGTSCVNLCEQQQTDVCITDETTDVQQPSTPPPLIPVQTPRLIQQWSELTTDMAEKLKPFAVNSSMASMDKLNEVQRAYVKWYVNVHLQRGTNREAIDELMKRGELEGIWRRSEQESHYIRQRVKYEQKRGKKRKSCDEIMREQNKKGK